jgi:membrane protease YdiL (CAAX protease family)
VGGSRALLYHSLLLSVLPLVLNMVVTPLVAISLFSLPVFLRDPVYYVYMVGFFLWPAYHALLAGLAVAFLRAEGESVWSVVGPARDRPWFTLLLTALMLGFSLLLFQVVQPLVAELVYGPGAWAEAAYFFKRIPRPLALYSVLVLPLTAGVCEELVWRGYLLTRFERLLRGRVWVAMLLQALLFGLWHGPSPFLPFSVFAGAVAGALYARTRRLVPLVVSHWLGDAVGLALAYFA